MYIKVIFGEIPRAGELKTVVPVQDGSRLQKCEPTVVEGAAAAHENKVPSEVLVNPDCSIRMIYQYIRETFQVGDEYELDLCDENGTLTFMYEKEYGMHGLNFLVPKTTYFLILFEKDEDNRVTNPLLYLPESTKKSSAQWNDLMGKIRKQLNPSFTKPSRISKTRSNTSHLRLP